MPEAVRALGRRLPPGILWGQAMLGSTLWATGPAPALEEAERILRSAGPVLRAGVDAGGARLVKGR
jgi:hypothetical protein